MEDLVVDLTVSEEHAGQRIDQFLAAQGLGLSRVQVKRLIDSGQVVVGGELVAKASAKVLMGDQVCLRIPPPVPADVEPQAMELDVLFEDDDILVVNKPAGLVVHPAVGHPDGTLVNGLLAHCGELSSVGGVQRPGIVHRLDKDTSGAIVVSKNDASHHRLAEMFADKTARRTYLAWVYPGPRHDSATIDTLYGRHRIHRKKFSSRVRDGKRAVTHFQVVERYACGAAQLQCSLETGRTHQIRVHCADAGFPILGDIVYSRRPKHAQIAELAKALGRQALHAARLELAHPRTDEVLVFEAPVPQDLQQLKTALVALN